MTHKQIQLVGRIFIHFDLIAVTGLHIGGTESGIEIGGVDKTVIRDPLSNRPYIPGSSFKGKMRSLLEKYLGLVQNQRIGQGFIHSCGADNDQRGESAYLSCPVCQVFGVPGERNFSTPTRLVVRDFFLDPDSAKKLEQTGLTDLPYTEVKTEVSIDRVTSAANPRQMERVPAGTIFSGGELVYSLYNGDRCNAASDLERLKVLVDGLQLLEDDYLGGLGSRGSGKVRLQMIRITVRSSQNYLAQPIEIGQFNNVQELGSKLLVIQEQIRQALGVSA